MPNPSEYENEKDFMGACVPMAVREGREQSQAVAMCSSMWKEKKSLGGMTMEQAVKHFLSRMETLVAFGAELKDLGDNKFGGYLVRFTTPSDPDLTGDYFDAKTELHIPSELPLLYNHGQDSTLKRRQIGKVTTKIDDAGVWAEAQLESRDEYEKAIAAMAKAGKLGYSSGALSHLVEREPAGKAFHIKSWWVGEASLTPSPAEFRNSVMPLKSLIPSEAAWPDQDAQPTKTNHKENADMEENEMKTAVDTAVAAALARRDAEQKAESDKAAALKAAREEGYKAAIEDVKGGKAPAVLTIGVGDTPENKNGGVTAFRHWIKTGQVNSELIAPDGWDTQGATKAAFNVTTNASGAFLVPDILYSQIQPKRDLASFIRQAPVQTFQTPADHLLIPATDTKHTAFTLTAEAAAYNENEATVKQVDVKIYKFTKAVLMSEEFITYNQTNFDAWLVNELSRAEAVTENTLYGTGAGGTTVEGVITNATAGNTVATSAVLAPSDLTGLVGQLPGGYNVQGQCAWLMKNATRWYIKGLGTSTFPWFMNTPENSGEQLLGYKQLICDDVGAYTSTSATAKSVTFGNFNFYALLERPGMMVQRNPYLYMATGQVGLFASIYRGGAPLQTEAFVYLVQKA